jgi:hypothetical protein
MGSSTGNAFDRLRLEAKFLLKDVQRGDEAAFLRFTQYWPATGPSGEVRNLARAQLVIARERGYRSWTHLKTSLLGNEERIMSEQKNAGVTDYRSGYSHKDVGVLLGIPEEQVGKLANEIMKDPPRFLTAVDIDRVWVKAKPWLVTLKSNDGRIPVEHHRMVQDAILKAGAIRVADRIQWRFATQEEAERAARQQPVIDGYAWIVTKMGTATPWKTEGKVVTLSIDYVDVEGCDHAGCYIGFPVLD